MLAFGQEGQQGGHQDQGEDTAGKKAGAKVVCGVLGDAAHHARAQGAAQISRHGKQGEHGGTAGGEAP